MNINIASFKNVSLTIGKKKIIIEIIRIVFITIFGLTAVDKLIHFERFQTELEKSPILVNFAHFIVWSIPVIELLVVSILVFAERMVLYGLYISVILMSSFSAYIYILVNYSYYTPCLCSAAIEQLTWEEHLVFNIILLIIAIVGVIIQESVITETRH